LYPETAAVDVNTLRHPVDEPAELSAMTGMQALFAKMRDYEGGQYGIAILTKFKVTAHKEFHYQKPMALQASFGKSSFQIDFFIFLLLQSTCAGDPVPGDYCQGALAVRVLIPISNAVTEIWFVTTHLGLSGVQLNESQQLYDQFFQQLLEEEDIPIVFTGDFNSTPDSPAIQYLVKQRDIKDQWPMCGKGLCSDFCVVTRV
jgi:endonuclease/exonuclease/phosphatase family metal-dependent hydrolase